MPRMSEVHMSKNCATCQPTLETRKRQSAHHGHLFFGDDVKRRGDRFSQDGDHVPLVLLHGGIPPPVARLEPALPRHPLQDHRGQRLGDEEVEQDELDPGPTGDDVERDPPVGVLVDEPTDDGSESGTDQRREGVDRDRQADRGRRPQVGHAPARDGKEGRARQAGQVPEEKEDADVLGERDGDVEGGEDGDCGGWSVQSTSKSHFGD